MSATHLSHLRGKDEVLTNLALGYMQSDFIGEQIMPVVYTDKEGIKVPIFGKGSLVEYETERAVGAASNIITLDKSTTMPVVLEEHDLAAGVDYRQQHESQFDEQAKATRGTLNSIVGYSVSLDYEYDLVDAFSKGQIPLVYDYTPKLPAERISNASVMTRKYLVNLTGKK